MHFLWSTAFWSSLWCSISAFTIWIVPRYSKKRWVQCQYHWNWESLQECIMNAWEAIQMANLNREANMMKTGAMGFLAYFSKPSASLTKKKESWESKGTGWMEMAMTKPRVISLHSISCSNQHQCLETSMLYIILICTLSSVIQFQRPWSV